MSMLDGLLAARGEPGPPGAGASLAWKDPVEFVSLTQITRHGPQSVDGAEFPAGTRVLLAGQADPTENGIYISATGDWVRSADADSTEDFVPGFGVHVQGGADWTESTWFFVASGPPVIGTDDINFGNWPAVLALKVGTGLSAGPKAVAFGTDSTANAAGDFAHGNSANACGGYSEASGYQSTASGSYSRAAGYCSESAGSCSEATGELAKTTQEAEDAFAQGGYSFTAGTAQRRSFVLRGSTPGEANAEAVVLKFGLTADQEIALLTGHFYNVEVRAILGHNSASTGDSMPGAFYQIGEVIVHGSTGAVTAVQHDLFAADLGGDLGAATLVWSSSGANNLRLTFTVGTGKKQKVNVVAFVTLVDALVPSWDPPA